ERVAVTQSGGVEPCPVVVDDRGTVDDLVATVCVDVADAEVVIPLSAVGFVTGCAVVAVEGPDPSELPVAKVPGSDDGAGIVAAGHDEARALAIHVGHRSEVAVGAIASPVTPDLAQLLLGRIEL